jgi:DNA-binding PadR family transcriptional regulator
MLYANNKNEWMIDMTIKYAILGFLSWQPLTGYDLKKMFAGLTAFYWSGNNNQIYKTLVQLLAEGLVTHEVQYQENSPPKKIYTITEQGLAALREWVLSAPQPPELRNTFLIQLAWADQLKHLELESLLEKYEKEVTEQLYMEQEKARRGSPAPRRNPREAYLWEMISTNIISFYENELNWIRTLRKEMNENPSLHREVYIMNYRVVEAGGQKYIECLSGESKIESQKEALELVAICGEHNTRRLMLHQENLPDEFFQLRTGIAGDILQKLTNYRIKTAAIISPELVDQGRFREMALEANRGQSFRIFDNVKEAEEWLIKV